jgi:hypothetical protein
MLHACDAYWRMDVEPYATLAHTHTHSNVYAGCCRLDGIRADAAREGLSFQNHHRGLPGSARSGHGETAAVVVCLLMSIPLNSVFLALFHDLMSVRFHPAP